MQYTTVVKVVEEGSNRPLSGLQVSLYDRDSFSRDDHLGTGQTDAGGEVRFDYRSEDFVDLDDRLGGIFPELYAVVYRPDGTEMHSTKADAVDNTPRKFITVAVPAGVAPGAAPMA
jgi:hypothetical protein